MAVAGTRHFFTSANEPKALLCYLLFLLVKHLVRKYNVDDSFICLFLVYK